MSEVLKKIVLPLTVLGFYPVVKLLSEMTINLPTSGRDIDVSLKVLEFLWAIILAVAMLHFSRRVIKSEE
jgi:hypothetical protein